MPTVDPFWVTVVVYYDRLRDPAKNLIWCLQAAPNLRELENDRSPLEISYWDQTTDTSESLLIGEYRLTETTKYRDGDVVRYTGNVLGQPRTCELVFNPSGTLVTIVFLEGSPIRTHPASFSS